MFANNMLSKVLLSLTFFLVCGVSVSALSQVGGSLAQNDPLVSGFTVLSADVVTPHASADVVSPLPFGHHSDPSVGVEPSNRLLVVSVGGSSLTVSEMKLVMNGGRNYDPYTKKWGYRDAFVGEKRNAFMLSWESHRRKSNVNQLLPFGERYSKE